MLRDFVNAPNTFLVGPPKCGTTAVLAELGRNDQVFVSNPKEPGYFVYQGGNPYHWNYVERGCRENYEAIFRTASDARVRIEGTTAYFACEHVAREIMSFNPGAKIVVILRNPLHRAFSMYRYWFRDAIHRTTNDEFRQLFIQDSLQTSSIGWLRDIGYYHKHLSRYLKCFSREQIHIAFYDDLVRDPHCFYDSLISFLGLPCDRDFIKNDVLNDTYEPRSRNVHAWLRDPSLLKSTKELLKSSGFASGLKVVRDGLVRFNLRSGLQTVPFPDELYGDLIQFYLDDIGSLEAVVSRDLSGWRSGQMK